MKICYIIGAGDLPLLYISEKGEKLIIAADGGLKNLGEIKPNLVVGDFDSLGYVPTYANTIALPVEKDVTDMRYAVDVGFEKGFNTFVLYGGTGGRPDHTFANYALLALISERGGRGYLVGENCVATAITDSSITLPKKEKGTVSVFAFGGDAVNVNIKGLKYTLKNHTLTPSHPLGVSNSFIGEDAVISAEKGSLLVMWEEESLKEFVDNL